MPNFFLERCMYIVGESTCMEYCFSVLKLEVDVEK